MRYQMILAAAMGLVTPQWYRPRALLGLADALIEAGHGGAILVSRRPGEEVRRHRIALTYPSFGPLRTLEEPALEAKESAPAASPGVTSVAEMFGGKSSTAPACVVSSSARVSSEDSSDGVSGNEAVGDLGSSGWVIIGKAGDSVYQSPAFGKTSRAERVGFEPTMGDTHTRFPSERTRPTMRPLLVGAAGLYHL